MDFLDYMLAVWRTIKGRTIGCTKILTNLKNSSYNWRKSLYYKFESLKNSYRGSILVLKDMDYLLILGQYFHVKCTFEWNYNAEKSLWVKNCWWHEAEAYLHLQNISLKKFQIFDGITKMSATQHSLIHIDHLCQCHLFS